jgi:hypothetical protein
MFMIFKAKWLLALVFVLFASVVMAANIKPYTNVSAVDSSANLLLYGVVGVKIKQIRTENLSLSPEDLSQ